MSDDKIIELLEELDGIATDYDGYEYGLPLHGEILDLLIESVREFIKKETK